MTTAACCLACHFAYEEKMALPYLPPDLQQQLLAEHQVLRGTKFPREATLAHAKREMTWFRTYGVPQAVLAQLSADHKDFEKKTRPISRTFLFGLSLITAGWLWRRTRDKPSL